MKLSCTNLMVPGNTLTEKALLLKRCGFDGISVFADIDTWNEAKEIELLNLRESTGMEVCEFCFSGQYYGKLMSDDRRIAEKAKELSRKAIHIGNQIGAISEMEYQYGLFEAPPLFQIYQKMDVSQKARFCSIFSELASELSGSAKLLLEPINRYESQYLNTVADNLEIIREVDMPGTGLLADIFHMSIEEKDICTSLRRAKNYLCHVHLGDNTRLLPGKGHLNWKEIFDTLKEIGYEGYVNLECALQEENTEQELKEAVGFLRMFL